MDRRQWLQLLSRIGVRSVLSTPTLSRAGKQGTVLMTPPPTASTAGKALLALSVLTRFSVVLLIGCLALWTEYLNLAEGLVRKYTDLEPSLYTPYSRLHVERRSSSPVAIFHSFGATESKPPEDGDAIIDNTETGRTLRANGLKIIDKIVPDSTARLLVNRRSLRNRDKQAMIHKVRDTLMTAAPQRREEEPVFGHI